MRVMLSGPGGASTRHPRRLLAATLVACVAITGFHLPTAVADPVAAEEWPAVEEAEDESAAPPDADDVAPEVDRPETVSRAASSLPGGLPESVAVVSTLAGTGASGSDDGPGAVASFVSPRGMHVVGDVGYVFDTGYLRTVDLATGKVRTVAGTGRSGSRTRTTR